MKTSPHLLACLAAILPASAAFASASSPARHREGAVPTLSAASVVAQSVGPSRTVDAEAEAEVAPFFSPTKTCLLLGTIGALALVVRRRGVD
jgi:hypothetical protein